MIEVHLGRLVAAFESGLLPKLTNDSGLPVKATFQLSRIWRQAIESF